MQAATLRVKLKMLDTWNARRKVIAAKYLSQFEGKNLVLPYVPEWADPVWHLFVLRTQTREALQANLLQHGINTMIHYPVPPHLQMAYAELNYKQGSFPIAELIHREVLSLPIGPHMTLEQINQVTVSCREAMSIAE